MENKLITLAIHTYQKAQILKLLLENEGIEVYLHNVNLIQPVVSSGVRVRIKESDLPAALKIIESAQFLQKEEVEMTVSRKILVPVDFSDYSIQACETGFNFADNIGAEVVVMNAYYSPFFPASISLGETFSYQTRDEETMKAIMKKAQDDLDSFSSFIEQQMKDGKWPEVKFSCVLRDGLPEEEIIAYSKKHKPVLIVMGTRGKNQKDADLIGSVTAEVIETAKVPVFAIPENTPFKNFTEVKRVAFGTSFEQSDLIAFDQLFKIFSSYNVEFYLFHISSKQDAWNEIKLGGIKEYFGKQYPKATIKYDIINANDFVLNLEKFVRTNEIDIISLTTHRRKLFARMFNPSIARKMLFHTDTPMLVLHP